MFFNINSQNLEILSTGRKDAPILIFIHGWPDSPDLWAKQVPEFESDYHCVLITIPNYGDKEFITKGCDFEDIVVAMKGSLDALFERYQCQGREKFLCVHDWGCAFGYLLESKYPGFFTKMICMDIGPQIKLNLWESCLLLLYQGLLIIAYFLGGPLGNALARANARYICKAPVATNKETAHRVRASMGYLYYFLWRNFVTKREGLPLPRDYMPSCPVLFMYGTQSPIKFFTQDWISRLNQDTLPLSKAVPVSSSHWFMLSERVHKEVTGLMKKFLD
mmetsp:Transcript_10485/g.13615  ORF Transcript_10485/g.13615 Transcript_10485/m.13615 type:complete len:277 (+) Transcript_10485:48-878(+)|eukprot:CAMPEP_0117823846 /NCGR_PEP_ID=MMETSP0949-20121206/4516_1 /TAXON_ID=44440 /ORGANISM="Chattonella subsalsa, Strain CCMP2191" /LENGTH=276 /DNA_ID=CAMNT_0005663489 /DNA_START=41 /DNA_END=871 /DNA_ORIENTATION=+